MDVYLLQSRYTDGMSFDDILIHVVDSDIWIDVEEFNDYKTLSVVNFTDIFWKRVKSKETTLLTRLGKL